MIVDHQQMNIAVVRRAGLGGHRQLHQPLCRAAADAKQPVEQGQRFTRRGGAVHPIAWPGFLRRADMLGGELDLSQQRRVQHQRVIAEQHLTGSGLLPVIALDIGAVTAQDRHQVAFQPLIADI